MADALRSNRVTIIVSSFVSLFMPVHVSPQALTSLDLFYNEIGAEGAQHLADALRSNKVSIVLSLLISFSIHVLVSS